MPVTIGHDDGTNDAAASGGQRSADAPGSGETPIRLVYVLSTGRSGSTLLEMLLASDPRSWTVGEVQLLPFELADGEYACGCGERTVDCPFWQGIGDEVRFGQDGARLTQFREAHNLGKTWRLVPLVSMLLGRRSGQSKRVRAYGDINAALFRSVRRRVLDVSGDASDWLVDASKDPYRLYWLLQDRRFDVRVIHLYRGAHGFVNSSLSSKQSANAVTRLVNVVRLAFRWTSANMIYALVVSNLPKDRFVRMSYEALAQAPDDVLAGACEAMGVSIRAQADHFQARQTHAIAGNQMRTRRAGVVLDEKWRRELGAFEKLAIWAICGLPTLALRKGQPAERGADNVREA